MRTAKILILSSLSLVTLAGCGPKQKPMPSEPTEKVGVPPKPPVLPPIGPERVETQIDQSLRSKAISELNKAFASNDPVLRANAVEGMQRGLGTVAADRYKKALGDPSSLVRFAGAMAIGATKIADAKPILLSMHNDPDLNVEVGVRYALHRLGEYRYSHDLEDFALKEDAKVRANVVVVLGLLGETSALKILRSLEADRSNLVRLQVLEAEYRLNDPEAEKRLYAGAISQFPDDRILCLLALGAKKDPKVTRFLEGQLVADWPEVSLAAARALGMVGADTGYGMVLKYVDSKEARQRSMAAMALGDIGRSDSQKYLSKLLGDSNPAVRVAAATAILQLKQ